MSWTKVKKEHLRVFWPLFISAEMCICSPAIGNNSSTSAVIFSIIGVQLVTAASPEISLI